MTGCGGHTKGLVAYIKGGRFFDLLRDYQIMKEDIAHGDVHLLGIGIVN
jgi:hypothetical protein